MNIRELFPPIVQFTLQDFINQSQGATSALMGKESSDCVFVSREGNKESHTYCWVHFLPRALVVKKKSPEGGQVFLMRKDEITQT